ncbi:MAG: InlB B-repeat-containing protein [Clostridia bacterium]|nr:InlB B-repeat-containing protein [Clostridia bacterium]
MKKTKRKNWLISGLIAIALVLMAGAAFLGIPSNANTAYAAISDYDTDKTQSASLLFTSIADSPTSGTKDNWSWSGGSEKTVSDTRFFSLSAGASITITNNDSTTVKYLVYAGLRVYGSEQATIELSITHGSKNSSTTNYIARASGDSTSSEIYQAELLDTSSSVVTYVIKNNNANTINIFTNVNYYYGKPVTINFNKDGGSGGSDNASVNYYFPYSSINIPTKSGYKFLGYYDANGTTQYYNANGAPTLSKFDTPTAKSSLNLTAQWEIAEQAVNVTAGTGISSVYLSSNQNATSGSASGSKFNSGTTVYAFAKLAKGYKHKSNWTLVSGTEDTENAIYRVSSQTVGTTTVDFGTISADLITYSITYNLNGGTHGTTHPSSYNVTTNAFTISNPTRTGYTFKGWSGTGLSGDTNQSVSVAKGSIGNRTYTANWTAKTYDLTFNNGEGQGGDAGVTATYDAMLPNVSVPTLDGYTFDGYYDQENGAGNKYIDNAGHGCKAWDKDSAPTLYAYFTQNMVVAFDGYEAEYDRTAHTISVVPTNPTDATVMYGTNEGTYNLIEAPTYTNVGTYTVYFEVTKTGWTTYRNSQTVVITKTNAEYATLPAAVEGLIYNNEDLALITAGELRYNDSGDIVYKITYTNPDTEEEFATEYNSAIPQGRFATTYTVFYKALGNDNYNAIAEASFTVTIAQVDKAELLALIEKVDTYHGKIAEGYADIDADMMAERAVSQDDFIDKANVTSAQIAEQIEDLQTVFSKAKTEVVTQKIEEIGTVERTKESKALIDDARAFFDDLTEEEKTVIANYETLTESEAEYKTLVHNFNVKVTLITIGSFLGALILFCLIYLLVARKCFKRYTLVYGEIKPIYLLAKRKRWYIVINHRNRIGRALKFNVFKTKEEAAARLAESDKNKV